MAHRPQVENNIQLDLSNTYLNFAWEDDDKTLVTVGVSYSLRTLHDKLAKEDRFMSHGQCSDVHLGEHVQTSGYGQLGRSFGLLADHVQKIRIINTDGEVKEIRRAIVTGKDGQSIHTLERRREGPILCCLGRKSRKLWGLDRRSPLEFIATKITQTHTA